MLSAPAEAAESATGIEIMQTHKRAHRILFNLFITFSFHGLPAENFITFFFEILAD